MTRHCGHGGRALGFALQLTLELTLGLTLGLALALAGTAAPPASAQAGAEPPPSVPASAPAPVPPAPLAREGPVQVLVMLRTPAPHARLDGSYGGGYADGERAQAQSRVARRLAAAHGLNVAMQWPLPQLGMDCVVMTLPNGASLAQSIAALQTHAEVVWAQPVHEFEAQGHTDPLYRLQPTALGWHLDELHAVATGREVRIALVDSAVDAAHPDLGRAVEVSEDFVEDGRRTPEAHGTALAGLVAARADNGIGIVGIAPEARLLALRACWEAEAGRTLCNSVSLAKALAFAIDHHADIINMSLSGPPDRLLGRLIDLALARRLQVVAAVDARALDGGFPADHPGVIAVADDAGPAPPGAWSAPSHDLPAPAPGGGFRLVTGSSFGAAEVAGLLAVLQQAGQGREARLVLVRTPAGGIDACASLLRLRARSATACPAVVAATATSTGP